MQPERLDDDIIRPDDACQAPNQLRAEQGGVVGELDAVATVTLEDLQSEAVVPRVGDQDAVALAQAQVVTHLVGAGAQDDGDHVQVLAGISLGGRQYIGWHGCPQRGQLSP